MHLINLKSMNLQQMVLPEFIGYTIKIVMSGTNQARPPRISELRTIAIK